MLFGRKCVRLGPADMCCLFCCVPFGLAIGISMIIVAAVSIDQCQADPSLPYLLLGTKVLEIQGLITNKNHTLNSQNLRNLPMDLSIVTISKIQYDTKSPEMYCFQRYFISMY